MLLKEPPLTQIYNGHATQATEIQYFYDRLCSDMVSKSIEGSITKTYLKKIRLHNGEYYWTYDWGLKSNDGTNMIYLILISINPATSIDVSNIKYEIEKSTQAKFGNNVKDLIDYMSSNYSIVLEKG